jgi:hypothetical protein
MCGARTKLLAVLQDDDLINNAKDMSGSDFAPDQDIHSKEFVDKIISDNNSVGSGPVDLPVVEKVKKGRPKKMKEDCERPLSDKD